MYKLRFKNIIFLSNKPKFSKDKYIIFFYGLGCASSDLSFILKKKKYHILIPELPGHNGYKNNDSLEKFSKTIALLLKDKKTIIFFGHSVGGIIPILICKFFLKNKRIYFINYEGNLTEYDTATLTKKTVSFTETNFIENKFHKLVKVSSESNDNSIKNWSKSLQKTLPKSFYKISLECVHLSKRSVLLSFYRIFFKKKIYLYGENTKFKLPLYNFGSMRLIIKNTGHFSYFDDKVEFTKMFDQLLIKGKHKW